MTSAFSLFPQAQQLTDLEQKLAVAKGKLEKAALDKVRSVTWCKHVYQLWTFQCYYAKTSGSLAEVEMHSSWWIPGTISTSLLAKRGFAADPTDCPDPMFLSCWILWKFNLGLGYDSVGFPEAWNHLLANYHWESPWMASLFTCCVGDVEMEQCKWRKRTKFIQVKLWKNSVRRSVHTYSKCRQGFHKPFWPWLRVFLYELKIRGDDHSKDFALTALKVFARVVGMGSMQKTVHVFGTWAVLQMNNWVIESQTVIIIRLLFLIFVFKYCLRRW